MTERTDAHRLLAQYLAEIRQKPLLTPAQELALGERKNAGAKARQQVTSGSFLTREEGLALAETMRTGDQVHTALVEGTVRYVVVTVQVVETEITPQLALSERVWGAEKEPLYPGEPLHTPP